MKHYITVTKKMETTHSSETEPWQPTTRQQRNNFIFPHKLKVASAVRPSEPRGTSSTCLKICRFIRRHIVRSISNRLVETSQQRALVVCRSVAKKDRVITLHPAYFPVYRMAHPWTCLTLCNDPAEFVFCRKQPQDPLRVTVCKV